MQQFKNFLSYCVSGMPLDYTFSAVLNALINVRAMEKIEKVWGGVVNHTTPRGRVRLSLQ